MEYMIWIWLGAAVVFGILEAMTAGLISVWFVAGAVAAMAAAMLEADVMVQAGVFIVVSALALALTRPLVRRWTQTRTVATNADRVLGQMAKVTETVDNDNSMGAVYVDGKTWSARSSDGSVIPAGTRVQVERMEGVKLFVSTCEKKEETTV
ncbi:MAG: NfeD family protein [Dysosmobacter sp.]